MFPSGSESQAEFSEAQTPGGNKNSNHKKSGKKGGMMFEGQVGFNGSRSRPVPNGAADGLLAGDDEEDEQSSSLYYDQEIFQDEKSAKKIVAELFKRPKNDVRPKLEKLWQN